ncbi:hypothetical protein ACFC0M_06220 [Streptomyces sp. NPDC056149]|uniref:hypothetical protein n=1 Tax=Streptomyces sp. NPDC056149 TaxID=3345728 RepID=UPI0035D5E6D9
MAEDYHQRAADARALSTQLRTSGPVPMDTLAQRIVIAQELAHTALADALAAARADASRTDGGLAVLGCLARASQHAQEAAATLSTTLTRSLDHLHRSRIATGAPPVTIGPPPHELRQAAATLLDRVAHQYTQASDLRTRAVTSQPASPTPAAVPGPSSGRRR